MIQYEQHSLAKLRTKNHEYLCTFIKVIVKKMSGTLFIWTSYILSNFAQISSPPIDYKRSRSRV